MIDIKFLRENPDIVKENIRKKYNKVMKRYKNNDKTILKTLTQEEFRFVPEINKVISE